MTLVKTSEESKIFFSKYFIDIVSIIFIFFLSFPYICSLKVPYLNTDEFGYWGSAAYFSGYDWSSVMPGNGYFSYGYGMILSFLFLCTRNPILRFRLSIFLNALILIGLYFLLKKIVFLVIGKCEDKHSVCCLMATLCCSNVTYLGMSLPECLLSFLFAVNIYLFLLFYKTESWCYAFLLVVTSIYMYTVHQRTIVFLLLNTFFLIFYLVQNHKKLNKCAKFIYLIILMIGGLLFYGTFLLKANVQQNVWRYLHEATIVNDYSGQVGKMQYLFSLQGLKSFLLLSVGRLFYLITSTYGLILLFLFFATQSIFRGDLVTKKLSIYLLLSLSGAIGISSLFMISSNTTTYLLYGRYCENIVPVILIFVLISLERIKVNFNDICLSTIIICILGLLLQYKIDYESPSYIQNTPVSHIAINIFYNNNYLNLLHIVLIITFILFLGYTINIFIKKRSIKIYFSLLLMIFSIYMGYKACSDFYQPQKLTDIEYAIEAAQSINVKDIKALNVIVKTENQIGQNDKYGKIIQFIHPELNISLRDILPKSGEYFIAHSNSVDKKSIEALFENNGYIFGICK